MTSLEPLPITDHRLIPHTHDNDDSVESWLCLNCNQTYDDVGNASTAACSDSPRAADQSALQTFAEANR